MIYLNPFKLKGLFVVKSQQAVTTCYTTSLSTGLPGSSTCTSTNTLGGATTYNYCIVSTHPLVKLVVFYNNSLNNFKIF